jgi:hypothetical protein
MTRFLITLSFVLGTTAVACDDDGDSGDDAADDRGDDGDGGDGDDDDDDGDGDGGDGDGDDGDGDDGNAECSAPSDCPNIVCDCEVGPVNYKACLDGTCATASDCAQECANWEDDDSDDGDDDDTGW